MLGLLGLVGFFFDRQVEFNGEREKKKRSGELKGEARGGCERRNGINGMMNDSLRLI